MTTERITDIIEKVNAGEAAADDRLTSALYSELRRIAANQLRASGLTIRCSRPPWSTRCTFTFAGTGTKDGRTGLTF